MLHFHLPNRIEGEKIIILLRRHWFILFKKFLLWLIVAAAPWLLLMLLGDVFNGLTQYRLAYPVVVIVGSLYYLFLWLFVFFSFVDYYLDVWIVTNERIINIEQKGLFSRTVSEQKLYRIQDVTAELQGIFPTFLNYGTIYIQTAAEQSRFTFKEVPRPQENAKKITQIVEQNKKFHRVILGEEKIALDQAV